MHACMHACVRAPGGDVVADEALVLEAVVAEELCEAARSGDRAALARAVLLQRLAHHAALRQILYQLRVLHRKNPPFSELIL